MVYVHLFVLDLQMFLILMYAIKQLNAFLKLFCYIIFKDDGMRFTSMFFHYVCVCEG